MTADPSLPADSTPRQLAQDRLTHDEIAVQCERLTGVLPRTSTLSAALSRATLTETTGHRFFDCLPCRVRSEHAAQEPARMLRLLGRRRSGFPLDHVSAGRLDSWLAMVRTERVVVAYCPEHSEGFVYVDESMRSGPNSDIPIRVHIATRAEHVSNQ